QRFSIYPRPIVSSSWLLAPFLVVLLSFPQRAMSTATTAAESRPVIVLVDPTWNFELENFDVERFFEEAKVTEDSVGVLRGRFERFCSTGRG
ncbi:unnamed protein product, partial [Prorocentrum cordatum]